MLLPLGSNELEMLVEMKSNFPQELSPWPQQCSQEDMKQSRAALQFTSISEMVQSILGCSETSISQSLETLPSKNSALGFSPACYCHGIATSASCVTPNETACSLRERAHTERLQL